MIQRQRRGDERLPREDHQADAVVRTFINEIFQHRLSQVNAVDAFAMNHKVLGNHAAGQIQRRDNVNAAGLHLGGAFGKTRLRERDDEQRQGQPAQRTEKSAEP